MGRIPPRPASVDLLRTFEGSGDGAGPDDDIRIVWAPWLDLTQATQATELALYGDAALCAEQVGSSPDDFDASPGWVWVNKLLETREQLANLITYMDGKSGAEELVSKLLQDPALLQTLALTRDTQVEPS